MLGKYIAFDCETTGLCPNENNLLTAFFMILDNNLEILDSFNLKLKHKNYFVSTKALQVNKINLIDHDNSSLNLDESREKLLNFLNKNKGLYRYIPIGHNINFDIQFLKSSGLLTEEEYTKYISPNSIDTIVISQFLKLCNLLPSTQSISLTSLNKFYNLGNFSDLRSAENDIKVNAHDAEYDIKITIKLLKTYKNLINENLYNENDKHIKKEIQDKIVSKKRKLE